MSLDPNEELAKEITDSLLEGGLIRPEDESELISKLKTGSAAIGDWKVWAEKVIEYKGEENVDTGED